MRNAVRVQARGRLLVCRRNFPAADAAARRSVSVPRLPARARGGRPRTRFTLKDTYPLVLFAVAPNHRQEIGMRLHALMVLLSVCAIVPAHAKSGTAQAKAAAEPNALTGTWEIVDA